MFAGAARLRRAVFLHVPPPAEKGFDFGSSASRVKFRAGAEARCNVCIFNINFSLRRTVDIKPRRTYNKTL